jgi:hypothetical protein
MAIYADLTVDRGSYFESTIEVNDVNGAIKNLTGYLARGKIRKSYTSSTSYSFTTSIPDPETGKVIISLSPQTTLSLKSGRYVYDVEVYEPDSQGDVVRIVEGQVDVTPSVVQQG